MRIRAYNIYDEKIWLDLPDNGELTPEARWVFAAGHCHSFALAIQRLTGWKLVVRKRKSRSGSVQHVFVAVEGRTPLTLIDSNCTWVVEGQSPDIPGVQCKFKVEGWLKAEVDLALPFARTRLAELEQETEPTHYPMKCPPEVFRHPYRLSNPL